MMFPNKDLYEEFLNSSVVDTDLLREYYTEFEVSNNKPSLVLKIAKIKQSKFEADAKIYQALAKYCIARDLKGLAELFCIRMLLASPKGWWALNQLQKIDSIKPFTSEFHLDRKVPDDLLEKYFPNQKSVFMDKSDYGSTDINRVTAHEEGFHELDRPHCINNYDFRAYSIDKTNSREAFLLTIPNGKLWFDGFNFVVWNEHGEILNEVSTGNTQIVNVLAQCNKPVKLEGEVALLGNRIATNYYHWMYDVLPRLGVIEQVGIAISNISTFVVTAINKKFQKETLETHNIGLGKIHSTNSDGVFIEAESLLIPSYGSNEYLIRNRCAPGDNLHSLQAPWASKYLKKTLMPVHNDEVQQERLKIYVSRGGSNTRGLSNEKEFIEKLKSYGFTILSPENLTVSEQATLFSRASVVIAAHGAALTNAVFCSEGTRIIEFHGPFTASCFWIVSNYMKLNHYTYLCNQSKPDIKCLHGQNKYSSLEAYRLKPLRLDISEMDEIISIAIDGLSDHVVKTQNVA